ncbi:MAG: TonB-dependent receptor [Acidobacteria bacterium]|nr:TonB-dependent receptor [Acidobacteriota bacterium]
MNPPSDTQTADEPDAGQPRDTGLVEAVVVTGTRAGDDTPAPHTNVSRQTIEEAFWAQDMPALLRVAPSVHHYADAGVDLGYSYLSLRGFDQRRVAVTLNGVPLNGAETHQVYWVDLPNFADSVEDIQIQRGVGLSFYGPGAIGGSIRLETDRVEPGQGTRAKLGYGSFETSKAHVSWSSDRLAGGWVLGLSGSRLETEGYRDRSAARMTMAFFTAQRTTDRSALRINVFGGREETQLAYLGLTQAELDADRRANPLDEDDTFTQPHLQVIHEWRPRSGVAIENTVFAFHGRGRFDQRPSSLFAYEVKITDPDLADRSLRGVSRLREIKEWDYGWLPRVTWESDRGVLVAGAEVRIHRGRQWGDVRAEESDPGLPAALRYYDYEIPKETLTGYAHYEWHATDRVDVVAGLQRVVHRWELRDVLDDPVVAGEGYVRFGYDVEYAWWAPRLGVNVALSPKLGAFASVSESRREPTSLDLYNIQEWYVSPSFREIDAATGRLAGRSPKKRRCAITSSACAIAGVDRVPSHALRHALRGRAGRARRPQRHWIARHRQLRALGAPRGRSGGARTHRAHRRSRGPPDVRGR